MTSVSRPRVFDAVPVSLPELSAIRRQFFESGLPLPIGHRWTDVIPWFFTLHLSIVSSCGLVRLRLEAGRVWDGSSVILWALRVLILCFAVWRTQLHRGFPSSQVIKEWGVVSSSLLLFTSPLRALVAPISEDTIQTFTLVLTLAYLWAATSASQKALRTPGRSMLAVNCAVMAALLMCSRLQDLAPFYVLLFYVAAVTSIAPPVLAHLQAFSPQLFRAAVVALILIDVVEWSAAKPVVAAGIVVAVLTTSVLLPILFTRDVHSHARTL